jgi:arabinogalactan endo-1,4-beta-galactosidase
LITDRLSSRQVQLLIWTLVLSVPALATGGSPIAGADFSHLAFFEDRGIVYRDAKGPRDALSILRNSGLNLVRLRLYTSSPQQAAADPYNSINNLDYTVPLAVRVKQAGLRFLLDFHYSDSWADPEKQTKPSEWQDLAFPQLEQRLYDYTSNAIVTLREAGAAPDIVQVGNEIIGGFLWPEGRVGGEYDTALQWSQLGQLLKSAIQGVKDGSGDVQPEILIHIDRGGDWGATRWFFDRLLQEEVQFDLIGQSYYPWWHRSLSDLRTCLNQTAVRYGKPLLIVETAFPWDDSASIEGIPATPAGQVEYTLELTRIFRGVPGGKGMGICWWGAEYVRLPGYNLAGFDRRSFFNFEGEVFPVVDALGQSAARISLEINGASKGVTLTWPLSGVGMILTTTPNLSVPGVWTPADVKPQWDGPAFTVTLPRTNEFRLYRLETP